VIRCLPLSNALLTIAIVFEARWLLLLALVFPSSSLAYTCEGRVCGVPLYMAECTYEAC